MEGIAKPSDQATASNSGQQANQIDSCITDLKSILAYKNRNK